MSALDYDPSPAGVLHTARPGTFRTPQGSTSYRPMQVGRFDMATHSQTLRIGGGVRSSLARLSGPFVLSMGTLLLVLAVAAMPNRATQEPRAASHGQLWIGTATTVETLAA